MANWAQELSEKPQKHFEYRGLRPALLGNTLGFQAQADTENPQLLQLWINLSDGSKSMQATVTLR